MNDLLDIPQLSYGVTQQYSENDVDAVVEQVRNLGYAILDSGYSSEEIQSISEEFNLIRKQYSRTYGDQKLKDINEHNTLRALLTHNSAIFLNLALRQNLLAIINKLIKGDYILNQQNGIINPPKEKYSQGAWHRDLPYQHFVTSSPLAINALFCLDDFTLENGATYVLPASHLSEAFPSWNYINKNAIQVTAKAGSFILLDCMLFHTGGFNVTNTERRAINHVYSIPFFKQQINIPLNMKHRELSSEEKKLLGFNYVEPISVTDYLLTRDRINNKRIIHS